MRYITLTDVKTMLGISTTSKDDFLKAQIRSAEDQVDNMLSVSRLDIHKVSEEIHDANTSTFYLHDLHVVEIGAILDDDNTYTQDEDYDVDNYILRLEDALVQGERDAKITYAAGWNFAGIAKLTVSDYSLITSAMTIAIAPGGSDSVTLTEGTEWDAETSNNVTAQNIADAINDEFSTAENDLTGVRAFALENVVYIADETADRATTTLTASALNGLTLVSGGGTAGVAATALDLDGIDGPRDISEAVILLVEARLTIRGNAGLKSYKIGSKSVSYSNSTEVREQAKTLLKPYMRANVLSV